MSVLEGTSPLGLVADLLSLLRLSALSEGNAVAAFTLRNASRLSTVDDYRHGQGPRPPGSSTDLVARLIAPGLGAALGQPVLIENMAGVGGIAGVSRVAKAAPDGYQFVVGNVGTHAQNQFLFAYPPYDALVEFVPAALLVDLVMLLAVRADLPIDGLSDFIAYLHVNAANTQYASAGFCSNVAAIKPHIEAGRLKAPALLSRARLSSLPNVATAQEQGVKDFEASNWMALFLPSATPEPIVARLNSAAVAALADPTLQTKLRALGAEPAAPDRNTPERLAAFLAAEREKWGAVIRKANILSLLNTTSGSIRGAAHRGLAEQRAGRGAGPTDGTANPFPGTDAFAVRCNSRRRPQGSGAGGPRRRRRCDRGTPCGSSQSTFSACPFCQGERAAVG
jgi:tripartite-type tricarboxylate transporter receptor subunit TctC